jgi:uncharacterized protein YkwD
MPARRSRGYRGDRRRRGPRVLGVIVICVAVLTVGYLATVSSARILDGTGIATAGSSGGCPSAAPSAPSGCPQAAAAAAPAQPSVSPATRASTVASSGSPAATPNRTAGSATPSPAGAGQTEPAARQVLQLINKARARAGLPLYTLTGGLLRSSRRHNNLMAHGCGLSHQCPGEPPLGARETTAGVPWTTAGENIGEGGPVADTPAAIAQLALTLTRDMLGEKPPGDGHRLDLLNPAFHHIGIAIDRDSSGTVWLTQDFAN